MGLPIDWGDGVTRVSRETIERLLGVQGETVEKILDEIVGSPDDSRYDPGVELGEEPDPPTIKGTERQRE